MNRIIKRMAIPVGAAIILGSSGFAFMDSNYVQPSYGGVGVGAISGYDVTHISFDTGPLTGPVDGGDSIQSVTFTLNHPAKLSNVEAWVYNSKASVEAYADCSVITGDVNAGTVFKCASTSTPVDLTNATRLYVGAAQ